MDREFLPSFYVDLNKLVRWRADYSSPELRELIMEELEYNIDRLNNLNIELGPLAADLFSDKLAYQLHNHISKQCIIKVK